MKIGILTHHYINNYGAFLQAWALCKTVKELFPSAQVQIIDYINLKHFVINTGGWFRFYKNKETLSCWIQKTKLPWIFSRARKKEMALTPICYRAEQINALDFDCIIFGSDEIWNYEDRKSDSPIKFGIGLNCENLIAYAPSVGKTSPSNDIPSYVAEGLKKFRALSARDDLTCELVRRVTSITPPSVLDPTFLTSFPKARLAASNKPYILFYYCDRLPTDVQKQIFEYARSHDLAVYGAGECNKNYSEITVGLTPFEWIEMFRNAAFVFTGTFHGTVFSILCKRQFKVYLANESRMKKVRALLKELGIRDREMGCNFQFDLEGQGQEIDYALVFKTIGKLRQQSLDYLYHSIRGSWEM